VSVSKLWSSGRRETVVGGEGESGESHCEGCLTRRGGMDKTKDVLKANGVGCVGGGGGGGGGGRLNILLQMSGRRAEGP